VSGSSRGGSSSGRAAGGGGRSGGRPGGRSGGNFGVPFIFFGGGGGGRRYGGRYGSSGTGRGGCAVAVAVLLVLVVIVVVMTLLLRQGDSAPVSTYQREPLAKGVAVETAYLKDDAHWISDVSGVERSMKYFYDKTGVMPYLWIAESINGATSVSDDEARAALNALYDGEITDEGHIVILFLETNSSDYDIYYVAGAMARTVLDQEACDILMNYFVRYYTGDYDDNEYFSKVFSDAADRIMSKTVPTGRILIFVVAGLIALICVCWFVVTMVKRVNERKRVNAEILNTPIDKDDEIEDEADKAAKKYD
jgi:Na+-transporting methylmalonyl-CoA/oxaloacetate decarboxylase gamma subunit